jgi:hypothetical protein
MPYAVSSRSKQNPLPPINYDLVIDVHELALSTIGTRGQRASFRAASLEGVYDSWGDDQNSFGNLGFSFPPEDSGRQAWIFLAACFVVDALIWGREVFFC